MSTSTEYIDGLNATVERRFYPRVTPPTPIYVAFGSNNLGVLQNVSENGLQVTTPGGLTLNSVFRVFLSLKGAPKTITVTVRTVWTDDAEKRSGIQLLDLADEDRAQIRQWVEFEMSRSESSAAWRAPGNGDRRVLRMDQGDQMPVTGRQNLRAADETASAEAPSAPPNKRPLSNAEQRSGRRFNGAFVPKEQISAAPLPDEVAAVATAASESNAETVSNPGPLPAAHTASASAQPNPAGEPEANAPSAQQAEVGEDLPKIANPFDHPDPNAQFDSPFAKVPLPIHGEFEYASQPRHRRRPTIASRLRARPLVVWAAILALVCFGANALVRYKIKLNSQHYAKESAQYTPPKSDDAALDSTASADDSRASTAVSPATDPQPVANSNTDSPSKDQASSQTTSAAAPAKSARNEASPANTAPASQQAPRRESSLDARESGAYTATAPPASDRSQYAPRAVQPAASPRTWSAPAPTNSGSSSGSSGASASETPQSPNVTSSSDNAPAQTAPIVSQTRPTPPPAPAVQPQSSNNAPTVSTASNASIAANNPAARTQQQPPPTQTQTYASNTMPANTAPGTPTPSRSQSQIYNANAQQQHSPIMGSINSVHSSGIFDAKDTTTANAVPSAGGATRGSNSNSTAATRGVANSSVVPTDLPQERDISIPAPKGFKDSYVEVPGEHVVRTTTATIRMRRLVRVPGEKIPGQRWLWRGKLDVTLGDVVNRIDPAAVQASGATGSLTVQATIDKDGYVTDLKPINGNFAMLPSVSRAVRNWHYEPTYLDSKRAETQAQIEFDLRPVAASNRTSQR